MEIKVTEEQLFAKIGRLQMECETRITRENELIKMIQDLRIQPDDANIEPEPPAKAVRSTRK